MLKFNNTGGERGIRTLGTLSSTSPFQGGTFDHSAISPFSTSLNIRFLEHFPYLILYLTCDIMYYVSGWGLKFVKSLDTAVDQYHHEKTIKNHPIRTRTYTDGGTQGRNILVLRVCGRPISTDLQRSVGYSHLHPLPGRGSYNRARTYYNRALDPVRSAGIYYAYSRVNFPDQRGNVPRSEVGQRAGGYQKTSRVQNPVLQSQVHTRRSSQKDRSVPRVCCTHGATEKILTLAPMVAQATSGVFLLPAQ